MKIILFASIIFSQLDAIKGFPNPNRIPTHPSKRPSSYPFISGDSFRNMCDHIFDETDVDFVPENVHIGDTIFINGNGNILDMFFKNYYHRITHPFIIVSHNTDDMAPGEFHPYLEKEKILAWFAQNIDRTHPKLYPIPIGLANYHWPHGKIEFMNQALHNITAWNNRIPMAYVNFAIHTNSIRRPILNYCSKQSFCHVAQKKPYGSYLEEMKQYTFVISPPGGGFDCHRNWEALLLGCILVVQKSSIESLFDDLPVIIVDNLTNINYESLLKEKEKLQYKTFNMNKLYAQYWIDLIKDKQAMFRLQPFI